MKTQLVFWTAFNSYRSSKCMRGLSDGAPHPVATDEWTLTRARLWVRYTLPSILAQTHADWRYVVLLDPELRRLTDRILPEVPDERVIYCYEDEPVLAELRKNDEIVLALIDADDMYSRTAGEVMMACPANWMYFANGFALEEQTGNAWRYNTIGTGPFFARRISPAVMESFDRDKRHPTHKAVAAYDPVKLQGDHFCVLLHDINTSSKLSMRYVLLDKPIRRATLKASFGDAVMCDLSKDTMQRPLQMKGAV